MALTIGLKARRQPGCASPNTRPILLQSSTEFDGRRAGVGYSTVAIGCSTGAAPPRSAKMAAAKSCQVVAGEPAKWKVPQSEKPEARARSRIARIAAAISAAGV